MTPPRTIRALLATALLLSACGDDEQPVLDAGSTADGGAFDAGGGQVDGGTAGTDAGSGGSPPDVTLYAPVGARRGPITLLFDVVERDGNLGDVRLERFDGANWVVANAELSQDGVRWTALWDSFSDENTDLTARLRVVAADPDGDGLSEATVDLKNAADTDRVVIVSHKLRNAAGGGATPDNNEVSIFLWGGSATGVVGAARTLQVGQGAGKLRASPDGRASLLLEERNGTVALLQTPLDGLIANVIRQHVLVLGYGSAADMAWSRDGRTAYVVGYGVDLAPARLWSFSLSEDGFTLGQATKVTDLPGPPSAVAVDPSSGRILVAVGSGGEGLAKVVLYSPAGTEIGRIAEDFAPVGAFGFNPVDGSVLMGSDLFGDDLRRFVTGDRSIVQLGPTITTVRAPTDVVYHPSGSSAVISNLDRNTVTGLSLTPASTSVKSPSSGIPLAAEMDMVHRGSDLGQVLICAVTEIHRLKLAADGSVTTHGPVHDFGGGTNAITHGISIQR